VRGLDRHLLERADDDPHPVAEPIAQDRRHALAELDRSRTRAPADSPPNAADPVGLREPRILRRHRPIIANGASRC
jgi:hypothetical protein